MFQYRMYAIMHNGQLHAVCIDRPDRHAPSTRGIIGVPPIGDRVADPAKSDGWESAVPQELCVWLNQVGSDSVAQPAPDGASLHTAQTPRTHTCAGCGLSDCDEGESMLFLYVDIGHGLQQGYIHDTCLAALLPTLNLETA